MSHPTQFCLDGAQSLLTGALLVRGGAERDVAMKCGAGACSAFGITSKLGQRSGLRGDGSSRQMLCRSTLLSAIGVVVVLGGAYAGQAGDIRVPLLPIRPEIVVDGADAPSLFAAAQLEFKTANLVTTQRLLIALMERYPSSQEARLARALYRHVLVLRFRNRQRSGLGGSGLGVGAGPETGHGDGGVAVGFKGHKIRSSVTMGWRTTVKLVRRPQEELVMSTGDRVFFAPGSSELGAKARRVLRAQAKWLKRHPTFGFEIAGHADEPGSRSRNVVLSLKRADAVRKRLIDEGISRARVRTIGLGRSKRIALCDFAACLAQNRRVVVLVRRWSLRRGLRQPSSL